MRVPLLEELVTLSVAFELALAAPSSGDSILAQQGRPELQNGPLFRRDNDAMWSHSKKPSLSAHTVASTSFITLITPSPGASAISITSQGQIITSYSLSTICPDPAPSSISTVPSSLSPLIPPVRIPSANASTPYRFAPRQVSGPYANATTASANATAASAPPVPDPRVASCSVTYVPTTTPICHTTLTPLGGIAVPISACDQNITFSTDHGIASTAGSAVLLTSYYVAPWRDVVTGVPTGVVDAEIYNSATECSTVQERWSVSTATVTRTQTDVLSVSTVVTGPALVILDPSSTLTLEDSTPTTITTSLTYEVFSTSTSWGIVQQTLASGVGRPTRTGKGWPSATVTRTSTSTMTVTVQGVTRTVTV